MTIKISRAHRKLVVPRTGQTEALFPSAMPLDDMLVVPHELPSTIVLRSLGYKVPNPMNLYYDFPGGKPFDVQRHTVDLMTTAARCYVLNSMGCVDANTEYLGEDGWHRIADYRDGNVAQYHPATGEIEFVAPTEFVKLPCKEMIRFKTSRGVDQLLSPEHRVLLDNGLVVSAENVEQLYGAAATERLFKFRTTFKVAGRQGIPLTDAQIRVQIAVNADGYLSDRRVYIRLKKQRKIGRLRALLTAAKIPYNEAPCEPAGFLRFSFVPPMEKGFTTAWWNATQDQLCTIASELVHWDGSARKALGRGFFSSNKADADFAQYAYSASGCRASLATNSRGEHTVHAAHGKTVAGLYGINGKTVSRNVWREPSTDGFKYCFMVPSTFLLLRRNGCIFATGNTGKTRATLWAWDYLHGNGFAGKLLVVATLSTLRFVWQAEAFSILPHRKVEILHGTKKQRLERLAADADIYVINHDGLKTIMPELLTRTDIDVLALDEVAVYRNNSERSKDMRKFAQRFKVVWGLTGRPMPNEPTDVWGISKVVTPNTSPKFFRQAQEMLMTKINNFKFIPKPEAIERAMAMLQPNVRFELDDVVELPEVISRTIDIPLTKPQEKVYKALADQFTADVGNGNVTAVNAAVAMGKLLQVSGGWVYAKLPSGDAISVPVFKQDEPMPRHQTLIDLINENERKVIVYVPFRHAIEGLSKVLDAADIEHAVVHGEVSGRSEIFNAFQHTTKYKVLVAHPQCVAHGLTLTVSDHIIWYMPITSLEIFEQANARITRVGQKHKQRVTMLQSTQVERKIYSLLQRKQKIQDTLLELLAEATDAKAA